MQMLPNTSSIHKKTNKFCFSFNSTLLWDTNYLVVKVKARPTERTSLCMVHIRPTLQLIIWKMSGGSYLVSTPTSHSPTGTHQSESVHVKAYLCLQAAPTVLKLLSKGGFSEPYRIHAAPYCSGAKWNQQWYSTAASKWNHIQFSWPRFGLKNLMGRREIHYTKRLVRAFFTSWGKKKNKKTSRQSGSQPGRYPTSCNIMEMICSSRKLSK